MSEKVGAPYGMGILYEIPKGPNMAARWDVGFHNGMPDGSPYGIPQRIAYRLPCGIPYEIPYGIPYKIPNGSHIGFI